MSNKNIFKLVASIVVVGLLSCASKSTKNNELDRKVRSEPRISSPEEIASRAVEILSNAPGITFEQKTKLSNIYTQAYLENYDIRTEIGQSMSLLFKYAAQKDFKSPDVAKLKNKIKELNDLRIKKLWSSFDQIQAVVGYGSDKEETYKYFEYYDFPFNSNPDWDLMIR